MSNDFIGRGENRTVEILSHLFPKHDIFQQKPLKGLIPFSQFLKLGKEHSQHKHDIVLQAPNSDQIVIEVNYKHGPIAEKKWHNVYKPHLEAAGHLTCTIEDSQCVSLFDLKNGEHKNTWQDWIDVLNALQQQGIMELENG